MNGVLFVIFAAVVCDICIHVYSIKIFDEWLVKVYGTIHNIEDAICHIRLLTEDIYYNKLDSVNHDDDITVTYRDLFNALDEYLEGDSAKFDEILQTCADADRKEGRYK
jgi:hypothetical protein